MTLLPAAIALIKRFEGFSSTPYLCPAELWTIGYGHTQGVNSYSLPITDAQAEQLLRDDLAQAERVVSQYVIQPLTPAQYSALVSFVFNIGEQNFRRSTLLSLLNSGDLAGAADELPRWVYGGGQKLKGLVKRRQAEREMFLSSQRESKHSTTQETTK